MFRSWTQGRCGARSVVPAGPLAVGGDVSSNTNPATASNGSASSPWSPFRHASFSVVWAATVISNIGGWMYSAASGWLMTDLNPDPFIVSMVQVATTLPMFLFALPAGALADIVDRRKFLIVAEVLYTALAVIPLISARRASHVKASRPEDGPRVEAHIAADIPAQERQRLHGREIASPVSGNTRKIFPKMAGKLCATV